MWILHYVKTLNTHTRVVLQSLSAVSRCYSEWARQRGKAHCAVVRLRYIVHIDMSVRYRYIYRIVSAASMSIFFYFSFLRFDLTGTYLGSATLAPTNYSTNFCWAHLRLTYLRMSQVGELTKTFSAFFLSIVLCSTLKTAVALVIATVSWVCLPVTILPPPP